jgi:hypothetical protein
VKKSSVLSIVMMVIVLFLASNSTFAQSANSPKLVKVYLKNNSLLPKGVGIKEVKPNAGISTSFRGSWMPFASKMWEVPVGTRLEYIADKSAIMGGNASSVQGKLIIEVKASDEGKTFSF